MDGNGCEYKEARSDTGSLSKGNRKETARETRGVAKPGSKTTIPSPLPASDSRQYGPGPAVGFIIGHIVPSHSKGASSATTERVSLSCSTDSMSPHTIQCPLNEIGNRRNAAAHFRSINLNFALQSQKSKLSRPLQR